MICHANKDLCNCIRDKDHTGPHVCDCGGSYDNDGKIYSFPREAGFLDKEQADALGDNIKLVETLRKLTDTKL